MGCLLDSDSAAAHATSNDQLMEVFGDVNIRNPSLFLLSSLWDIACDIVDITEASPDDIS